jgi:putative hydrolase of the HAD superfamily
MVRHRAVFFDLGGTLFSYRSINSHFDGVLEALARGRGVERPLGELRAAYRGAMARVMLDWAARPYYLHRDLFTEAHVQFLRSLGVDAAAGDPDVRFSERRVLGIEPERSEGGERARDERSEPEIAPRDDAAATLAALRARGLHVQIVSNIDADQLDAVWPRLALDAHVDAITTSEEARSCKPDPGIFRIALEKAGNPEPSAVVFVGDSVLHDIAGAKALGMTSVLIGDAPPAHAPANLVPHHVIESLSELLALVRGNP